MVLANANNGTAVASSAPSPAVGFNVLQTPTGGFQKTYVDSSGNPVADQSAGYNTLYGASTPNGGQASSTPVVTSSSAQADLAAKMAAFNTIQTNNKAQADLIANNQLQAKQSQAEQDAAKLAQQNIDTQNAQKQQEINAKNAALASTTANKTGEAPTPPVSTPPQVTGGSTPTGQVPTGTQPTPTNGTTPTNPTQTGLNNAVGQFQSGLNEIQTAKDALTNDVLGKLNSVLSGTFPLSAPQQALISSLQTQLTQQEQQQGVANQSYVGSVTQAGFRSGGEYTPAQYAGQIANAVSYGVAKIAELDNNAAKTMATLQSDFQKQNYDMITKNYDILTKQLDDKETALKDMYTAVTSNLKDQRDYQLNVDKFVQSKDQFERTQTETEKQNAFDRAYKTEELALKRRANAIAEQQLNVPSVGLNPQGKVDKVAQQSFLASLPPATATMVQNLASYTANPANLSARIPAGGTTSPRQQMIELAHQFDPTYDESQYAARAAYNKSLQSGTIYQATLAANKSINHLISFDQNVKQLGNVGGYNVENQALNMLAPFRGTSQALSTAKTEATGVSAELAKFFKGSGTSDVTSVAEWSKSLDVNNTPANQRGLVQGAVNLLSGQLNVMNQQYQQTMGKSPESSLLLPETTAKLANLKDQGYQVDVPGVYYTNKDSFFQYGGGSTEKLSSARQMLLNAQDPNNPPTPENILQLAQIIQ